MTGDLAAGFNHFQHGISPTSPKIESSLHVPLHRPAMYLCQVAHMNIITNSGPIRRLIIHSKNLNARPLPQSYLQNIGYQVSLLPVIFPKTRRGSSRVKITKDNRTYPMSLRKPRHHPFKSQLGMTIRAYRILRTTFINRHRSGNAIGRTGRGEHQLGNL